MTGVEKVREWAIEAKYWHQHKDGRGPKRSEHFFCEEYCLAYGAYLRGLIEVWKEWHSNEYAYTGEYDRDNSKAVCKMAIAAWKDTIRP